jgi:sodium/hydrogen exchanger 8
VFKRVEFHDHVEIECLLVFLFSYIAYATPEIAGLSGVISLFVCGIVLAHYNW